ncbi:MAG: ABC transporter permease [Verrucomicrobiales bacterium]|nr:ABC transporter permease [Verrucomicrobiales bacterium]
MRIAGTFRLAIRALLRNTLRSILTMLGIIIGVGAVVAMAGIGNGAKAQVESQIATLGQNMILIFSGSVTSSGVHTGWGSASTLRLEDAAALKRELPETVVNVSPEIRTTAQIAYGNQNWLSQLLGESAEYFEMRQWGVQSGTTFGEQEVRSAAKVAVIGSTASRQLFGSADPVGSVIRVKHVPFTIIGVLKPKGISLMGSDQDDVVIIPYTTAMRRVTGDNRPRSLNVQAVSAEKLSRAVREITELLRQQHRIGPGRDDDFMVRSQQEIAEMATATANVLTLLLGAIASVSLLVGGIGIMNIMLVSVTERTREIGTRIAVGAHGADILVQFLIEAITLSSLGGLLGVGLGLGASSLLANTVGWPVSTSVWTMAVAFVFSAAVGVFFGLFPAWKASTLDPIEALRYE